MDAIVVAIAVVLVLVALNVFSEPDRPAAVEDDDSRRRFNQRVTTL